MNTLQVEGVGLMAPGLAGWPNGRAVLAGERPYAAEPMPAASAALLPANERRRTTATVKLALHVTQEAALQADIDPGILPTVLASSGGDSEVVDRICAALTLPERPVSPTHFHHSVHNTPAGYWSIATRCTAASLSLSAYDDSFAAGLMEAAALAWTDRTRVLLVAYDLPPPFPLSERRVIVAPFAVALVLNPAPTERRLATLRLARRADRPASRLDDPQLETLRLGNPAARSLPLLRAIARSTASRVTVSTGASGWLELEIEP
ncbi:MAG: beta-ketoacyl synthase chain length factor [Candidatus Competibacteraceae bacterium]|nr:MAG: beta-ketoacyl synthase chain length factor [Candidatus Competibacteraceae bacterium]